MPDAPCHHCHAPALNRLEGFQNLPRVTSDCKPWPAQGSIAICENCFAIIKPDDAPWQRDADAIYSQYDIYHQAAGMEQLVFDAVTGQPATRSSKLLQALMQTLPPLPVRGRWLDVGCGNGATLKAAHDLLPDWKLTGTELSDTFRDQVMQIPGVEAFHAGVAQQAQGPFDVISLIHVLEHIPDPAAFLATLAPLLSPGGRILIEVPDHQTNPFDLLIADHASHFSPRSLGQVIQQAGLGVQDVHRGLIAKELTAVATTQADDADPTQDVTAGEIKADVSASREALGWLSDFASQAKTLASRGKVGVFGTSIAGTWLGSVLGDAVVFFVDEDAGRHGRRFMGRPVLGIEQVPPDVPVILALAPAVAKQVKSRLAHKPIHWWLPTTD